MVRRPMIKATRNAVSAAYTSLKESAANQLRGFIGATGTMILGGYITGEDFNTEWEDDNAVKNAREMVRQDSMINGTMMAIKLPCIAAIPRIEPASEDNVDMRLAEFAEHVWFDNPFFTWPEWTRNALYYLDFGFEIMEKSYVPFPGIGDIPKFQHRKPETIERWHVGDDGELANVEQLAFHSDIQRFKNVMIPFEKIFHISRDQEGHNYRGLSLLRSAWRPYKIKDLLIRIDAIKGERWGAGIPRGKMTAGGDERQLIAALQDLRANEKGYLYEDKNYSIDLLTIAGRAGVDLIPSIELHNKEINANILREHASLGTQTSTGSWALGETDANFFLLSLGAILTHLEEIVNRGSGNMENMKQIIDVNFPRVDKYPQLKIERPKLRSTVEVAKAVTDFTQAGVITPDEELEDHVRKLYDLPKKVEPRRIDSRRAPVVGILGRARQLTALEASILDVRAITSMVTGAIRTITSAARGHRDEAISKALQFRSARIIKEALKPADVDRMLEETVIQNSGAMAKAVKSEAWSMHVLGTVCVMAELDKQGVGVDDAPEKVKKMQAYRDTDLWAQDLATGFCAKILKEWAEAVRLFWLSDDKETRNPVRGVILSAGENLIESGAQRLVLAAFGMGRRREIERSKHLIDKLHRSEALEAPNCGNCAAIDGIEFQIGSEKHKHLADGPNKECTASACWGLNIPIAKID